MTSTVAAAGTASAAAGRSPSSATSRRPNPLFPPLQSGAGDLLALPADFTYEVVAVSGETDIHDGTGTMIGKTPERPDGTTCVRSGRNLRLIQNHEASPGAASPVPFVNGTVYDPGALGGGCTVIETDRDGKRVSEWVGLSGTYSNCAGGPTPWGSWLTCEETEAKAGTGTLQKDYGYVFEVFADLPAKQSPLPIMAWGRAPHEAVVVEPSRRRVYLTEDASNPTGLLYRWSAPDGYRLKPYIAQSLKPDDGTLEALAVLSGDGSVLPDLAYVTAAQIGRPFRTTWVNVPDRHASSTSLRKQFADGAVTHSKKLEGAWGDDKGLYFVASFASGAADLPANATKHDGQLWYYDYKERTLTLVATSPQRGPAPGDPRMGRPTRSQPPPGIRRTRRLPRLPVRHPRALRRREHRQPPAQLDPGHRCPGDRPQPDRPRTERRRRQRLQRDDRADLRAGRLRPVRQRARTGPHLRHPRSWRHYLR